MRRAAPVPSPLSLPRNFSWTLAANIGFAICQWGILVVLAKFGSPAFVGEFALGLAVTAPIMLLGSMSLRTVQATDSRDLYRFADYLRLRFVMTVLALLAIATVVGVAGYSGSTALTVLLVGAGKGIAGFMDVYHGLFQRHRQMNLTAQSILLNGVLSLLAMGVAFWLTGSVPWAATGVAIGSAMTLALYDVPVGRRLLGSLAAAGAPPSEANGEPGREVLARLARLALPLGVSAALISLAINVPRYAIEQSFGEASLGIFAALAYFMVAGNTVVSALAESALPVLATRYEDRDLFGYRGLLGRLLIIGACLGAIGLGLAALAGPAVVGVLYGPEYAEHQAVLLWLVAATGIGFVGWFLDAGISAARQFRMQLVSNGGLMVAMIIGSVLVIPAHGLLGAAWVVAGAMSVQTLLRLLVLWRVIRRLRDRARAAEPAEATTG